MFERILHDVGGQSEQFENPNRDIGDVEFPPLMAVSRAVLKGVMVVVPAVAVADQREQYVVAARISRFVILISEDMSE